MVRVNTQEIKDKIIAKCQELGVNPYLALAVAKQESGYNPRAKSPVGAQGIFQLMPATAKGLGVKNAFDVDQNIDGGVRYLKQKLREFGGNIQLALASYNAGSGAVKKYKGIPPYKETQNYVKNIMAEFNRTQKNKDNRQMVANNYVGQTTGASAPLEGQVTNNQMVNPTDPLSLNPRSQSADVYTNRATDAANLQALLNMYRQVTPDMANLSDAQRALMFPQVVDPQTLVDLNNIRLQQTIAAQQIARQNRAIDAAALQQKYNELEQLYAQDPRLVNQGYQIPVDDRRFQQAQLAYDMRHDVSPDEVAIRDYQRRIANQYGIPYDVYMNAEANRLNNIANLRAFQIQQMIADAKAQGASDQQIVQAMGGSDLAKQYVDSFNKAQEIRQKNFEALEKSRGTAAGNVITQAGGVIGGAQAANREAAAQAAAYDQAIIDRKLQNAQAQYNAQLQAATQREANAFDYDIKSQRLPAQNYQDIGIGAANLQYAGMPVNYQIMPSDIRGAIIEPTLTTEQINQMQGNTPSVKPLSFQGLMNKFNISNPFLRVPQNNNNQ